MISRSRTLLFLVGAAAASAAASPLSQHGPLSTQPPDCVRGVKDAATGRCVGVSSDPRLGQLYPLTESLNVDGLGRVGMGTKDPQAGLEVRPQVAGDHGIRALGRFDPALSGEGGAGVFALGGAPLGPGVLAVGAFDPGGGSAPGIVAFGGGDDAGGAEAGVEGFGGAGAGSLGGDGLVGHGGPGEASPFSVGGNGVVGVPGSGTEAGWAFFGQGDYGGTGAKYFVQPHPGDPAQEIRFVCLEGNESGTYFRGSARTEDGRAVIEVPEEFRLVSDPSGITVQTTAVGTRADLWIESRDLERIIVRSDVDVDFDYFVNGVRLGFGQLDTFAKNRSFVPEYRDQPYGAQYPAALRQILVENGILNADFTPNEQTALMMGWDLKDPADKPSWAR